MSDTLAIILAAGKSRRMKSALPKVLHEVCGRMLIDYVLDAARNAGANRLVLIIGHEAETVRNALSHHDDVEFALQVEQLGTGHAVMMAEQQLAETDGPALVLAGDTPLLKAESLKGLTDDLKEEQAACVIGTATTDANQGLGRVVRNNDGGFLQIVEERDATPEQKAIREINTGCYAFDAQRLLESLGKLRPENQQSEYYLTDCPAILMKSGHHVVAAERFDIHEAIGVNTRLQLAEVNRAMQDAVMQRLMSDGVTIIDPGQCWIDPRAKIGGDSIVFPFTSIRGPAVIGANSRIGPNVVVDGPCELPDGSIVAPPSA